MRTSLKILLAVFLIGAVGSGCAAKNRGNPYYYGSGGDSTPIALAAGAGLAALAVSSAVSSANRESTNQTAILEAGKNERERIRAQTVLNAPCALGGPGNATYTSDSGGSATIKSDVTGTPPCANASIPPGAIPLRRPEQVGYHSQSGCDAYKFPTYRRMCREGQIPPL